MNLIDVVRREIPRPWSEGDNIPWDDPQFSQRMLTEHLSQVHDAASRRFELIDRHVCFLHDTILGGQPARILDLGCGPGLYLERLATLGHACWGIDFSPASIDYARRTAEEKGLRIVYCLGDLRQEAFGEEYDLILLIYGEFNVFRPIDAYTILTKAWAALKPNGLLVLEPSPEEHIRGLAETPATWHSSNGGLFSDRPYLLLEESFWDATSRAATTRYYIIDAANGLVSRCAASYQAYTDDDLRRMLLSCGFDNIRFFPNLTGEGQRSEDFIALRAEKSCRIMDN